MTNNKQLKSVIETIKTFKDKKETFYRDNEADYYHKILEVIEFFQELTDDMIVENSDLFIKNLYAMNDFRDLFLELYNDDNYAQDSAKKSNFYKTINTLRDFTEFFQNTISSAKSTAALELERLKEQLSEVKEQSQQNYELYRSTLEQSKETLKETQNEFLNAKHAVEEDSRLYASKEYWNQKKQKHRKLSIILSVVFTLLIALLLIFILQNISDMDMLYLQDNNQTYTVESIKSQTKTSIQYLIIHFVQSFLILSLLIWLSRILLKIIFSNLHLKEEAYEKETMIVTYLALLKEGGGLRESDRSLILEAIFRPSTNGLIKDESSVTLLDVANVFKGAKR
ncbi:MAG: DUF6161 domain-containing protein [Campylobacterota bacterium]|nr:DUF6161 domain-containing protein [Campylobacterota bacterium]